LIPKLLLDARAQLGECPVWCERMSSLYWVDILSATLSRWKPADGSVQVWTLPEPVCSFALCQNMSQLLMGLASGLAIYDLERGALTRLMSVEVDELTSRINDGRCDRQGRFVFGMYNQAELAISYFYRLDAELRLEKLPLPAVGVANAICFSPDGSKMYFTDSPTRMVWQVDYYASGQLGIPQVFVKLPSEDNSVADGAAVDIDGGVWIAHWAGQALVRYSAEGQETHRIELSVTHPTCPAFGGAQFDQIFVTSARTGLDDAALARQPHAGGILTMPSDRRGIPEPRFSGRV